MSNRGSNEGQQWHCKMCGKTTRHTVTKGKDGETKRGKPLWEIFDGMKTAIVERTRKCSECKETQIFYELSSADWFEMSHRATNLQNNLKQSDAELERVKKELNAVRKDRDMTQRDFLELKSAIRKLIN